MNAGEAVLNGLRTRREAQSLIIKMLDDFEKASEDEKVLLLPILEAALLESTKLDSILL